MGFEALRKLNLRNNIGPLTLHLSNANYQGLFNNKPPEYYNPQANLTNTFNQNKLQNPTTLNKINIGTYYDPTNLQNDIYQGIKTAVNQQLDEANKQLNQTISNAGLFRSGINLANQNLLQRNAMDALAKGYGDTALNIAQLQDEHAKAQSLLDFDVSKYGADIQNAWKERNLDYLMNAAVQDQNAINEARKYNIQLNSAYDEMMYNWAKALLDRDLREYQSNLSYLSDEGRTIAAYGNNTAKSRWNNLGIDTKVANRLFSYNPNYP